jgi:hypothetical protein
VRTLDVFILRTTARTLAADRTRDRAGLDIAHRLLWLAVVFDILAFGVGFLALAGSLERVPGPFVNNMSPAVVRLIPSRPLHPRDPDKRLRPLIVPAVTGALRGSAAIG